MSTKNLRLHDKDWLHEQYIVQQRTYEDIGREIGVTKHGVYHAIKRFGIEPREHSSKYPQLNNKEWLRRMYIDELLSIKEIAKLIGGTVGNIHSALKTMGVKLRSPREAQVVKYPTGRFGDKAANWQGGISTKHHLIRTSTEYKLWRKSVFERDNYICRFCGQRGGELEADHIKPFAYFPELRLAIDNGRTLCKACHKTTDTHSKKAATPR